MSALVGPPAAAGTTWSMWRIGAPHHGVRQTRSRTTRNRRSPRGKIRRLDSIATSSPVSGETNSRRSHTWGASRTRSRAKDAGTGPCPRSSPGSSRSARSSDSARVLPEQRHVGHDELNLDGHGGGRCLTGDALDEQVGHQLPAAALVAERPQPVGLLGQRGVRGDSLRDRQEGAEAGHGVRRRAEGDPAVLRGAAAAVDVGGGVEPVGSRFASDSVSRSPRRSRRSPSSRSACSRSSRGRQAVSLATTVARHSLVSPAVRAAIVRGISWTRASASPTRREPRCGDSRRASATWALMPRAISLSAHAGTTLLGTLGRGERRRQPGLRGSRRGLQLLERTDRLDALDVAALTVMP